MAPKRPRSINDMVLNDDSDGSDSEDHSWFDSDQVVLSDTDSEMSSDSDGSDSSEYDVINEALYERCKKEYNTMKHLKKKVKRSLKKKSKQSISDTKSKDVFTRFSVTYFSKVIDSLSDQRREIICQYGFGCLLKFDKCFVPNKFAKWVAKKVDYKSGDIIVKDKVISRTKESVHSVLELPLGGKPFSSVGNLGKSMLLSKFEKNSVPSVKFFGDKLIKKENMSDEDVFICFILVALNCFLCPNSSLVPSSKYLSILEDLKSAVKLDWSKLIIDWLLDSVKCFNKPKTGHGKDAQTLGGCLYYLAVMYLDFVDFGPRQVPDTIPRVEVWKRMMIKQYSELDKIAPGVYGLRPVLDISKTCYKTILFDNKISVSLKHNAKFLEDLESYSGCALPDELKFGICDLIDKHCFNSGLSINMDITAIASLPNEMKLTFSSLLQHVYSVDTRTQNLVLNILKLVADAATQESQQVGVKVDQSSPTLVKKSNSSPHDDSGQHFENSNAHVAAIKKDINCYQGNRLHDAIPVDCDNDAVFCTQPSPGNRTKQSSSRQLEDHTSSPQLPVPNLNKVSSNSKMSSQDVENVMKKLSNKAPMMSGQGPSKFIFPPSGYPPERCPSVQYHKRRSRMQMVQDYVTQSEIGNLRKPFCDLTNEDEPQQLKSKKSVSFSPQEKTKDVIILDQENIVAPDSDSPRHLPPFSRYFRDKTPMVMHTLPSSPDDDETYTPRKSNNTSSFRKHTSKNETPTVAKKYPEVQVLGERCVNDTVNEMCKQAEDKYDKTMLQSALKKVQTPSGNFKPSHSGSSIQNTANQLQSGSSSYEQRDSTTGGKVPIYGPRRIVAPGPLHRSDFVLPKKNYNVSRSELANYKVICSLAKSKWKEEFAVNIGGVRTTFWSLVIHLSRKVLSAVLSLMCTVDTCS
ncbi:hypothetical protein ACP70R_015611 [Stipagrostis hirtigluma subsp. patula]